MRRSSAAVLAAVLLGAPLLAQPSPDLLLPLSKPSSFAVVSSATGPPVVRSRAAAVRWDRLVASPSDPSSSPVLRLNLFDDFAFEAAGRVSSDESGVVWTHREGEASAVLRVEGGRVFGSIRAEDGRFFRIRHVSGDEHRVEEIDYRRFDIADDAVPADPDLLLNQPDAPGGKSAGPPGVDQAAAVALDVLVVYTPAARSAAGGTQAIEDTIRFAVAEANEGLAASGAAVRFRLAGTAEDSPGGGEAASTNFLRALTADRDIKALRDQFGADVVSLWINGPGANGGTVGVGWLLEGSVARFSTLAYSIVEYNFAAGPGYAFAHEVGHNLGCGHDRENSQGGGAFPYSFGYQQPAGPYYTVMAYVNGCPRCRPANVWSNPNLIHQGAPAGDAQADNVRTLNQTAPGAAQWRRSNGSGPGPGPNPPPTPANAPPVVSSVAPADAAGAAQVFTVEFADSDGAEDIDLADLLLNDSLTGVDGCWVRYDRDAAALLLVDDTGRRFAGFVRPGGGSVFNSQCRLDGKGAAVERSGSVLRLTVPLAFLPAFSGPKTVFAHAVDDSEQEARWSARGTYRVAAADGPPTVSFSSPVVGEGATAAFFASFDDVSGAQDVRWAYVLIGESYASAASCGVVFDGVQRTFHLVNDEGTALLPPVPLIGVSGNRQCSLRGSDVGFSYDGSRLTLRIDVRFSSAFAGRKLINAIALDSAGEVSKWVQIGTWTVP